jgi:hypothetical protein
VAEEFSASELESEHLEAFRIFDTIVHNSLGVFRRCEDSVSREHRTKTQIASIAICSRLINHSMAVLSLTKSGLSSQAEIVSRSVFEELVNLSYICAHQTMKSDDLAERYILYVKMTGALYRKKLAHITTPDVAKKSEALRAEFKNKYPGERDDDWSGKKIAEKAREGKMELLYQTLYLRYGHQSHGSPVAYVRYKNSKNESDVFDYFVGSSKRDIFAGLATTPSLLVLGSIRLANAFGLPSAVPDFKGLTERIGDLVNEYYASWN